MKPASSSARTRRQQGAADRPTRCASSALVRRASACSSCRIARSNLSMLSIDADFKQDSFRTWRFSGQRTQTPITASRHTLCVHDGRGVSYPDAAAKPRPQGTATGDKHDERTAARAHPQGPRNRHARRQVLARLRPRLHERRAGPGQAADAAAPARRSRPARTRPASSAATAARRSAATTRRCGRPASTSRHRTSCSSRA